MMDALQNLTQQMVERPVPAGTTGVFLASVELAREGDEDAFADLVSTLHPRVFRWALTFAKDADDAEEITQETFVRVHRRLHQYKGKNPLEAWVYHITRNIALGRMRKAKRRRSLAESELPGMATVYETDPGARVDRERAAAYIHHFFLKLPPKQREVFDLVDLQGNDPADVARLIGVRAGAVRANLFKARASIRAQLLESHPALRELDR
jgi:RNA polymerase sigma factor (sigma-70 family)